MNDGINYIKPILFYDGYCNLCSSLVCFVKRFDGSKRIFIVPIQSNHTNLGISSKLLESISGNSVGFLDTSGVYHTQSDALLAALKTLSGGWLIARAILLIIPKTIRDYLYGVVAANRYRWWGKRDSCNIV